MKNSIITALIILQIVSIAFFTNKLSGYSQKLDLLISENLALESKLQKANSSLTELADSTPIDQEIILNSTPLKSNIDSNSREIKPSIPNNNQLSNNDSEIETLDTTPEEFAQEETDLNWAIEHEENIENLFVNSENLSEIGLVSVECRKTACKIMATRSNKGTFLDANTFNTEISKQDWHKNNAFSFNFGGEGAEEFVTFWIKR